MVRDGSVALLHALLRTRRGAAPGPHGSSGGPWVAGDVRLDGRRELVERLAAMGVEPPDEEDDDALLLAAWRAWGEGMLPMLRGDFSFALWDPARRRFFCARDPFGVRLLYYAELRDAFICSNVLAAVRAHPSVSRRLHEPAVVSFLVDGFNADLSTTTFADVRRVPPAHQLTVRAAPSDPATGPSRYWSFPAPAPISCRDDREYVDRYREVLDEAVRDRLRVPRAAVFLSGGLDSSSVAAAARRVEAATELVAYTMAVGPLVPDGDTPLATETARRLGLRHVVTNDLPLPLEHLADPAARTSEPFDECELAAWFRLTGRIAAEARVLFVAEDGDALFAPPSLLRAMRVWPAAEVLRRAVLYTLTHRRHPHLGLWLRRRVRSLWQRRVPRVSPWIRREVLVRTGIPREEGAASHPTRPETYRSLVAPVWQSLLESYDASFTGARLEARWPLLDTRVLEFVLAIPPVPWCQRKELVRVAFRDDLPPAVIRRPKTSLAGYGEAQVARWRRAWSGAELRLSAWTREYVDVPLLRDVLARGPASAVEVAWRALELDRWLRDLERETEARAA
jgi:asparagine synthase (glutamine-hydrolysing)